MSSIKALEVALWMKLLLAYNLRFVLRWRKDSQLRDAAGNLRLTWKIAQGKRGWSQQWLWDARRTRSRAGQRAGLARDPS